MGQVARAHERIRPPGRVSSGATRNRKAELSARSALHSRGVRTKPQREHIGTEEPTSHPCQHADEAALGPSEAAYDEEFAINTPTCTRLGDLTKIVVKGVGPKSRNLAPAAFMRHRQTCALSCVIRRWRLLARGGWSQARSPMEKPKTDACRHGRTGQPGARASSAPTR